MWQSLIAVLGTLSGVLVSGLLARVARQEDRREQHRRAAIDALAALGRALADHRRAMWEYMDAALTGAAPERVRELRDRTHETRSQITAPATRVRLLVGSPEVWEAARCAIGATYAMRNVADLDELAVRRRRALETADELVAVAAAHLAIPASGERSCSHS